LQRRSKTKLRSSASRVEAFRSASVGESKSSTM
jgi:hypothetical protein